MSTMTYLTHVLEAAKKDYTKTQTQMSKNVTEMGADYAYRWAESALKAEAKFRVAVEVQDSIDNGSALQDIVACLLEQTVANTEYLIPSSSDIASNVYKAQAYAYFYRIVSSELRNLEKIAAKLAAEAEQRITPSAWRPADDSFATAEA